MSYVVNAEIVASVLSVDVAVGDTVTADQAVCLLESMKMEIPVLAEVTGTVTEIVAKPGDVVSEGDPLIVITEAGR